MNLFAHEYALVLYGVIIYQIAQHLAQKLPLSERMNLIGRSMIWGGMVVVFDDEIADSLLEYGVDLWHDDGETIVWYFYLGIGFAIDIIRNKITKQ
jgi:hypothetical protein